MIAWDTIGDNIAEVGAFLGLVGGTLGKLSMDVELMMQTDLEEHPETSKHLEKNGEHCAPATGKLLLQDRAGNRRGSRSTLTAERGHLTGSARPAPRSTIRATTEGTRS